MTKVNPLDHAGLVGWTLSLTRSLQAQDRADLEQELWLAVLNTARRWNLGLAGRRGPDDRYSGYLAGALVKTRAGFFARMARRRRVLSFSVCGAAYVGGWADVFATVTGPEAAFDDREEAAIVVPKAVRFLSRQEQRVVRARFGFSPYPEPLTPVEIAKQLRVTRSRVFQIQLNAFRKLRMRLKLDHSEDER